uniref:methyltransferase family protein n=1 Tax=Candidatus Borrarchaeum sp. TaxID=2846742 RepID=UPI00257DF266
PLYLGVLLVYIGFILGTFSLISVAVFVLVALIHNKLATYEEQDLERIFGEKYLEYKSRVPKWIPRLSSAKI